MKTFKKIVKILLKTFGIYSAFKKMKILAYKEQIKKGTQKNYGFLMKGLLYLKILFQSKFVYVSAKSPLIANAISFQKKCKKMKLFIDKDSAFLYDIDFFIVPIICYNRSFEDEFRIKIGNLTVNYDKVLKKGLLEIKKEIIKKISEGNNDKSQKEFLCSLLITFRGIEILIKRYLKKLEKVKNDQNIKIKMEILKNVPLYPARNFREALQCILFINSLIWLDDHPLVGIGRLDQILNPYLSLDLSKKVLNKNEAYSLLKEFLKCLHQGYQYKSNVLLNDTGQVIVLGGKNSDNSDATKELTIIIMDALRELYLPDPKIVLRVHSATPIEIWDKAMECLVSGLQYPLFSNDEVVIPILIKFGYSTEDAFNYVVSACWEPLIPGKSLDQNNLLCLNFMMPFYDTIEKVMKNNLNMIKFDDFLVLYKDNLKQYVISEIEKLNKIEFEPSPLLSLLIEECIDNAKDISEGGSKYNNYGILSVGLGNVVNALLNIKRIIFEEQRYLLKDVIAILKKNFCNYEFLLEELKNIGPKFCMDDENVVSTTNELINIVFKTLQTFTNKYGGKFKFGLSSPEFISFGKDFPATLDGRKDGEPFGVHISPLPTGPSLSYTEIANFASKINYERCFNGAVLDVIVEKNILENNKEKFISFSKAFFKMGGFQLQFNILDYFKLIKAKENPDLFPNFIVRVWGYCSYFKDLPEEYKDLILKRAQYYEFSSGKYPKV